VKSFPPHAARFGSFAIHVSRFHVQGCVENPAAETDLAMLHRDELCVTFSCGFVLIRLIFQEAESR
jgi:hypothetical protein